AGDLKPPGRTSREEVGPAGIRGMVDQRNDFRLRLKQGRRRRLRPRPEGFAPGGGPHQPIELVDAMRIADLADAGGKREPPCHAVVQKPAERDGDSWIAPYVGELLAVAP